MREWFRTWLPARYVCGRCLTTTEAVTGAREERDRAHAERDQAIHALAAMTARALRAETRLEDKTAECAALTIQVAGLTPAAWGPPR